MGLSVVMAAQAGEPGSGEWEARRLLEESGESNFGNKIGVAC